MLSEGVVCCPKRAALGADTPFEALRGCSLEHMYSACEYAFYIWKMTLKMFLKKHINCRK